MRKRQSVSSDISTKKESRTLSKERITVRKEVVNQYVKEIQRHLEAEFTKLIILLRIIKDPKKFRSYVVKEGIEWLHGLSQTSLTQVEYPKVTQEEKEMIIHCLLEWRSYWLKRIQEVNEVV